MSETIEAPPGDDFPIEPPEGVVAAKPKSGRTSGPRKGSAKAKEGARKAAETRRARRGGAWGSTGGNSSPAALTSDLREIQESLADAVNKAGAMMLIAAPITGTYCLQTSDAFAESLTRLAAKNPKLLRSLQSSTSIMDYVAIGSWTAGLVVAIGIESGRVMADGPAARAFNLDAVAEEFYPPGGGNDDGGPGREDGGGLPRPDILGGGSGNLADEVGAGAAL